MIAQPASVQVSVLVPAKDEEQTLGPLVDELAKSFAGIPHISYEVLLVDDGSTDRSWAVMRGLTAERAEVRAIKLRRNFGKAAALAAGVSEARGARVVTMDADLQDDPNEVPRLLAELDGGSDLVSGFKADRKDPLSKRVPSRFFNAITGLITGLRLRDYNCGLKAANIEVYERLPLYGELHRYIPALAHQLGYRVSELAVNHRPRRHGTSKYGVQRYFRGAIDLLTVITITRFGRRPAHLFGGLGLAFGFVGSSILAYLSALWVFTDSPIGTRPLLTLGILLVILGVQMTSFGLIAEIILHRTASRYEVRDLVTDRAGMVEPAAESKADVRTATTT